MAASLTSLVADLEEVAHPLGGMAFERTAVTRNDRPQRPLLDYDVPGEERGADGAAAVAGDAAGGGEQGERESGTSAASAASAGGRKSFVRSVRLPRWMDLDQETLPNAPPPALGGSAAAAPSADGGAAARVSSVRRPAKLSDFGAVGELTVQMHTEAVPYGLSTAAGGGYEALLSDFAKHSAEKRQAKPARAPAPAGGGSRRPAVGREARGGPRGGPRGGTARGSEVPPESYVCHNCRQPGHWIANCPLPRQSKRPRDDASADAASDAGAGAGGGGGGGRGGGGGGGAKRPKGKRSGPPDGYVCRICNVPGHFIADCPLAPRERAAERPPPPPGYVCRKCNQSGHWVELCQLRGHHNPAPAVPPVTPSAESAEVGRDIAEALEEAEEEAVEQICRLVEVLGEEACRGLLVQAWQVEENGGLLRTDGSGQRRTPGGVFLWLVKQQATPEQRARVWPKAGQETPATAK